MSKQYHNNERNIMETSVVKNTLTDGSETFDVVFFDGSQKVVINAEDETAAQEIQEALARYATGGQVDVATLAEVSG